MQRLARLARVCKSRVFTGKKVILSLNLIQAAVDHGCMNFVFASTFATYGDQDNLVLNEDSVQHPINAYGASKWDLENILADYQAAFGLNHVIFRYFNVARADPDGEVGEFHQPEMHLIPLIFDAVDGRRDALTIFRTDYDNPDGTCIRDYIHVCDFVDAHVLGLKWLQEGRGSSVLNLGTGDGFSVRDVVDQPEQLGLGHAVPCAERVVGNNPFEVLFADDLLTYDDSCVTADIVKNFKMSGKT